ncbi:MAG TPA: sigma-70 family RNA polymerase sigma factor [Bryobacteraceae bacterium]|nr:sigma-70 family RNA polymerase sigma factor [Bryobacteraceae bacterium]
MQNPQQLSPGLDEDLVLRAKSGDSMAFSELVKRYYRACTNVAYAILRDRDDAEDETQNAVWKAYEHLGQFQSDSKFSTWLTRIVVNQCLMKLRQSRRAKMIYFEDTTREDGRPLDLPAKGCSPEEQLGRDEVAEVLRLEIRRIPPLLRTVFELRDIEQLPMEDVAARLGISVAAAKSRLLRARMELRNRLRKHEGRQGPATLTA